MTFREVSRICHCSHGSITAEKKEMLKEEAEAAEKNREPLATVFPDAKVDSEIA